MFQGMISSWNGDQVCSWLPPFFAKHLNCLSVQFDAIFFVLFLLPQVLSFLNLLWLSFTHPPKDVREQFKIISTYISRYFQIYWLFPKRYLVNTLPRRSRNNLIMLRPRILTIFIAKTCRHAMKPAGPFPQLFLASGRHHFSILRDNCLLLR